ncbi:hypothetical protein FA13DRAFT_1779701 [Coprinellus micaceus]|uniref:Uncharacterized protein n=1 Tax=Coprinellus micaceus TaxID=71717 RepID=A0A4Y7SHM9_COPMI|nr:hypothetical protein FA13DRAFT_1779701 [Coprinellus micaceus]
MLCRLCDNDTTCDNTNVTVTLLSKPPFKIAGSSASVAPTSPPKRPHCGICNRDFDDNRGFKSHYEKCLQQKEDAQKDKDYVRKVEARRNKAREPESPVKAQRKPWEHPSPLKPRAGLQSKVNVPPKIHSAPDTQAQGSQAHSSPVLQSQANLGDIRVEYIPSSNREEFCIPYERVKESLGGRPPWYPFQSRADFEIAKLGLEALNHRQLDALLSTVQRCISSEDTLSFKRSSEVLEVWEHAAELTTPFNKYDVKVPYNGQEHHFQFPGCSLWDWAMELVDDPNLIQLFEWDACKMSRYDGEQFIPFGNEPWTAKRWWDVQESLKDGGKPLFFILYTDETKLSSSGTTTGYPVVARITNLPEHVRNSHSFGGGRVVGLLPDVEDDEGEKGKPHFVDFKRVVWHGSLDEIFGSIAE